MDVQALNIQFYGSFHFPIQQMGRTIQTLLDGRLYMYNANNSFQNLKLLTSQMMQCNDEAYLAKDVLPLLMQNWDDLIKFITQASLGV